MTKAVVISARKILIPAASLGLLLAAFWIAGTEEAMHELGRFPFWATFCVLALFSLNLVAVTFRLKRILLSFGINLPTGVAAKASLSGHLAGLFFISLFGQVMGRHMVLQRYGLPSVLIATLTAYERAILLFVSGALCSIGIITLLGHLEITNFLTEISALQIAIAALGGVIVSLLLGRSRFEARILQLARSSAVATRILEASSITIVAQLLVLAAFVIGGLALEPQVGLPGLLAAAAVISFASSIPISVNGWGIRELASIYAFGQLGIPSSSALAISILVGLCSTIAILIAAPLILRRGKNLASPASMLNSGSHDKFDHLVKAAAWLTATATATLIFFQIHASLSGGAINLNLADPLAMLTLAAMVMHMISTRQLPLWRIREFNLMLAASSVLLVFAFFHGTLDIGVTQWALSGRLVGWLVLLGYLSVGYLAVTYLGAQGVRRLAETMMATAAVVVAVQITIRWLAQYGWMDPQAISFNFEGYAGNRNAFAFQMLVCSALAIGYSTQQQRLDRRADAYRNSTSSTISPRQSFRTGRRLLFLATLHAFILAGIVFSASRAGLITAAILLVMAWGTRFGDRRFLALSVPFALLIWLLPQINWLSLIGHSDLGLFFERGAMQSLFSGEDSNQQRWTSVVKGLELWLQSPILGTGLGTFIEMSTAWFDQPLVIHSTPVWILAEFGLVGAALFSWIFIRLVIQSISARRRPEHRVLAMLLLIFVVFCQAHEILYQRIFWLVLGAMLAVHGHASQERLIKKAVCRHE